MEDMEIIALYWTRDEAAIRHSADKYGRFLTRIAMNILRNPQDSEECVNDTYHHAWNAIPPQKPGSLCAFLGRITRNLSLNRWHASHAQKRGGAELLLSELEDCVPDTAATPEEETELEQLTGILTGWLQQLPGEDRILFLRRYWFGDPVQTLAMSLGTTPNKLAGRLYRLRKKLKSVLEEGGVVL